MKTNIYVWLATAAMSVSAACGGKKTGDANTAAENKPAASAPASSKTGQPGETDNAVLAFKVNGVDASTKPGAANDDDKHSALFNHQNNFLLFTFNGDDPKFPHRGYLTVSIENFNGQTGVQKCRAGFSRYTTANAGGETMYDTKDGGFNLNITSFEKGTDPVLGEVWFAAGTFNGKLNIKPYDKNEVTVIDITDGSFSKVPVMGYGKK